jgi:hypothetical protein
VAPGPVPHRTRLTHVAVDRGLDCRIRVLALKVAAADDWYCNLSEHRDKGGASTDDVVAAFGLARAASAVEFVRRGEPAEAIYEAAGSVEDWSELRAALLERLG